MDERSQARVSVSGGLVVVRGRVPSGLQADPPPSLSVRMADPVKRARWRRDVCMLDARLLVPEPCPQAGKATKVRGLERDERDARTPASAQHTDIAERAQKDRIGARDWGRSACLC